MKKLFLILSLAILGCDDFGESTYYETCSPSISGIYGGSVVEYKQGIVEIKIYTKDFFSRCSGFILNEDTVITAGHCLMDYSTKQGIVRTEIVLFDPCLEEEEVIFKGDANFWVYPNFTGPGDWGNDLAVIKSPVPWLNTNTNNHLSIWADSLSSVDYVTLYGIGYTNNRSDTIGTLKKGNRELINFSNSTLTTIAGKVRTCHGDSGGPIFSKNDGDNLVIGLTIGGTTSSFNKDDNCSGWGYLEYGIRLNTEKVDWIEQVTGSTCYYSVSEHGHGQRTCVYEKPLTD